jgi:hypothetical protein
VTRIWVTALIILVNGCGTGDASAPAGPYVVTAIDYHFHDAHPSLPIALDRSVQFSNQGRNPHNVTIEGTSYDRIVRPGQRMTIDSIGSLVSEPGRYPFVCRFHADRGMSGVLVVVAST